ncbi:MAG: N-acetylglucosamine-6-phosphate deacetylase [Enhydrobacter sp.]|nr:N-acetylglucosamine-6-phosphate deacetylase [Enhydrobacter sp.]
MSTPHSVHEAPGTHAIVCDRLFDGRQWHQPAALLIDNGRVLVIARPTEVPDSWSQTRLPAGAFLAPGFIDLQVNGGGGVLLNDSPTADSMRAIARAHRRFGTTGCLPTMITDTRDRMRLAIEAAQSAAGRDGVIGVHLEGPFISPNRPGIHRKDLIAQANDGDLEWLLGLADIGRSVVTLAPECVPAGFVKQLAAAGIRVSLGHSEASAEAVGRAADDGLTGVTHLFNAMPAMAARLPGAVGAALADRRLTASLLVDGIHVDPIAVRAAFAAKGAEGIALVTDAMPTVGATVTQFSLMGREIALSGGSLRNADGTLAGAHLDMASAVRNAVVLADIELGDALQSASLTPARFLGLDHERGALFPGARADLVALTQTLHPLATWMDGQEEQCL